MKLLFVSVGKTHDPRIKDSIEDFTKRIDRVLTVEWFLIPSDTKQKEAERILAILKPDDYVVLLDERGKEMSSPDLATLLQQKMNEGSKRLVFIIGGAYGADDSLIEKSNKLWNLSRLTFPHQLVRLILAEQIYRALSITHGEKYHHG